MNVKEKETATAASLGTRKAAVFAFKFKELRLEKRLRTHDAAGVGGNEVAHGFQNRTHLLGGLGNLLCHALHSLGHHEPFGVEGLVEVLEPADRVAGKPARRRPTKFKPKLLAGLPEQIT